MSGHKIIDKDGGWARGYAACREAQQTELEWQRAEIKRLRDALEDYACMGLAQCFTEQKLKDGSCIHAMTGWCGDPAYKALRGNEQAAREREEAETAKALDIVDRDFPR